MKPSAIIPRIRAQCASFANRVGGASDLINAVADEGLAVPSAYVVPTDEDAAPPLSKQTAVQDVLEGFAVIVAISATADDRGQDAAETLEDLKRELQAALCNWVPGLAADRYLPVYYQGGEQFDGNRARLFWQFDFAAKRVIQHVRA